MNFIFKLLIAIGFCIGFFILLAIICQTFLLGLTFSGIIFYGSIIAIFKNWKYTLAVLLVWIAYFKLSNSYDIHNSLLIVSNIILTVLLLLLSAFTKNKDDESDEFFSIEERSKFKKHFFYPILGIATMSIITIFGCYFYEIQRHELMRKLQAYMFDIAYDKYVDEANEYIKLDSINIEILRKTSRVCNYGVGNSWSFQSYIDGIPFDNATGLYLKHRYGTPIEIISQAFEHDNVVDYGAYSNIYNLSKKQLLKGCKVKQKVIVIENRGRYAGSAAEWKFIYKIKACSPVPPVKSQIVVPEDSIKKYFWTFSDLPYKAKYSSEYVDPIKNYKTREERITDSIKISKMLEGLTNISKNNKH